MSANFEAKKQIVDEIKSKIQDAKSVVMVKSLGLTVAEDTELRREFRNNGVDYKVFKNTLIRRAFNDIGVKDFDEDLNGPTTVAFGKDETSAAKVVAAAAKKFDQKFEIKCAYVDGGKVDASGVKALANIPSREQLIAMLMRALQGPVSGLARVLNAIAEKQAQA